MKNNLMDLIIAIVGIIIMVFLILTYINNNEILKIIASLFLVSSFIINIIQLIKGTSVKILYTNVGFSMLSIFLFFISFILSGHWFEAILCSLVFMLGINLVVRIRKIQKGDTL